MASSRTLMPFLTLYAAMNAASLPPYLSECVNQDVINTVSREKA